MVCIVWKFLYLVLKGENVLYNCIFRDYGHEFLNKDACICSPYFHEMTSTCTVYEELLLSSTDANIFKEICSLPFSYDSFIHKNNRVYL